MKTLHWILGALGAAALAVPAVASAGDDYDTNPDADVSVEGDGLSGDADIEGNGDDAWDGGLSEDEATIEGDGDVTVDSDEVTIEGDGYEAARQRQQARERGPDKGLKVQAQGGVISHAGEAASQVTPGAAYGVVVGIEPPIPVFELELGYQGAAWQTDSRLTGAQENAVENGGQALLMASPEIGAFEPYVFGGYQLSRFNVFERDNSTGALQDDTISKAPVGAGLDVHLGDVLVGARGQYNFLFNNDAFNNLDVDNQDREADQVSGTLLIGGQF